MKYQFLYETKNLVNNKIYVGVHSTDRLDDGYLGSGVLFRKALKRYGKKSFSRKILKFFYSQQAAYAEEFRVVDEDFINDDKNYNVKIGGEVTLGGDLHPAWGRYVSEDELVRKSKARKSKHPLYSEEMIKWLQSLIDNGVTSKKIAEILNEKGVLNTWGNQWGQGTMQVHITRLKSEGVLKNRSIPPKECSYCGQLFYKENLKLNQFKIKKCCSRSCTAKLRWDTDRFDQKIKEKKCSICDSAFLPNKTSLVETCSRACASILSHEREIQNKKCLHCFKDFRPKYFKAKYCSSDCYQKSRKAS